MSITTNGVLGGAMTGAILGAAFGVLTASGRDREENAKHYALLIGAIGAVVGGVMAAPPVVVVQPSA